MMPVTLPYRRGVGVVLVNTAGKVFVAERLNMPGAWQMPQGGIDDGETPRQAALRELKEEIGTDKAEIVRASANWLTYELPPELVGVAWKGKYRGQKQKWFLMRFTGTDKDIDIATAHPEFGRWKWLSFLELPKVIVAFKRDLYLDVVAAFSADVAEMANAASVPKKSRSKKSTPKQSASKRKAKTKRK
jgi:putative (di)nucleoside polyphosphate hydrolase